MKNSYLKKYWVTSLRQRNLSENTIRSYLSILKKYEKYIQGKRYTEVLPEEFQKISSIWQEKLTAETLNTNLSSLKAFYRYLYEQGHTLTDMREMIPKAKKTRRVLKKVLSVGQIRKLILSPDINIKRGYRDRCMMLVQYAAGIRSMELLGLKGTDINENRKTIIVTRKGGDCQEIPIGGLAMQYVMDYMAYVRPQFKPTADHFWCNNRGGPMADGTYRKFLKRHMRSAHLEGFTSHDLRHAAATHMVRNGADIQAVQFFLGHKSVKSTEIYVRGDQRGMRDFVEKMGIDELSD